jgi:predicted 2-oxoglutarate/Fe(II)-dependent dioxygenase YbiX
MSKAAAESTQGRILDALKPIDRPSAFCTHGAGPATLPGLEVRGVGTVGLPLSAEQAVLIREKAEQASYGKGQQTLVNTDVRRVWRLAPDRFALSNPQWSDAVAQMVEQVQRELGIEGRKLRAHLYDLLLYEKRSFFLPHRDSEKIDRMVATLVVVLPSVYCGGELIVRHEGREQVIDLAKQSRFQTQYAAFYADCEHEVRPLTEGYRLCLIYNLTVAKGQAPIGAPLLGKHVDRLADLLRKWDKQADGPQKLGILLRHQYTEKGLSWETLKGVDAARAGVLAEAARAAGFHIYVALLTFWEVRDASENYDRYEYGYDKEEGDEDEDDEVGEGSAGSSGVEVGEVIDESLWAEHWNSPDNLRMKFGKLRVEESEVVPKSALRSVEPEEDFEGYTGNAGMTLDRTYRHGALFLWPDRNHFDVLISAGAVQALEALRQMMRAGRNFAEKERDASLDRCRQFAAKIFQAWPEPSWYDNEDAQTSKLIDTLLDRLDDPKLTRLYLQRVLSRDARLLLGTRLVNLIARHGWITFRQAIIELFEARNSPVVRRNAQRLDRLCRAGTRTGDAKARLEAVDVCRAAVAAEVTAFVAPVEKGLRHFAESPAKAAKTVAYLVRAAMVVNADEALAQAIQHITAQVDEFPLRDVQIRSLQHIIPWVQKHPSGSIAFAAWMDSVRKSLEQMTATKPQPPEDYRRDPVKCTCADCKQLNRFLIDPDVETHGFQMNQGRRSHLEDCIRDSRADLSCRTDRRPRPQVLVCTKTTASYERRLKEYEQNLRSLEFLGNVPGAGLKRT